MADVFDKLINRAKEIKGKTLIFPEGEEKRVKEAVKRVITEKLAHVVVLGDKKNLETAYNGLENITLIDPSEDSPEKEKYAKILYQIRASKGLTEEEAYSIISDANYYACVMLYNGDADGIVSGAITNSADVMRPAFQIVKQKSGVPLASSSFIMEVPKCKANELGENGFMVFADCAVVPHPNAEELAGIAYSSAETAKNICGMEPRVSLLSYTSFGVNPKDEEVLKIKQAVNILNQKYPKLLVEGDLQADASIVPETAKRKVPTSKIGGRANVLVFPNIFAGNIGYKLVQQFAGVRAVGPIMQGLNKPINDLSRGCSSEEIYLTAVITLLQTQG